MAEVPPYLQLMEDCAQYTVDCYIKSLANTLEIDCPVPTTRDEIPEEFRKELRMLAQRLAEAIRCPCEASPQISPQGI